MERWRRKAVDPAEITALPACKPPTEEAGRRLNFNDPNFARAAWVGIALQALATAYSLVAGDWIAVLFMAGFLAASGVFVAFEDRLPTLFDLLFVGASLVNAVGWAFHYYDTVWGYDELVHFYTTFAVTLSVGYLVFFAVREHFRDHRFHFVVVISSFGISIGALWEIFEWIVLPVLTNPVEDLIMDTLGALLAGLLAAKALGAETAEREEKGKVAKSPA
jgi:hypothetical protein